MTSVQLLMPSIEGSQCLNGKPIAVVKGKQKKLHFFFVFCLFV